MKKTIMFIALALLALSTQAQTVYVPNGASGIGTSSNGNVGIGVANPISKLDINGQITIRSWDAVLNSLSTENEVFPLIGIYQGWNKNAIYLAGYNASNRANSPTKYVSIGGSPVERLWVDLLSGNVGIGTTAPLAKLHINSGANNTYASILATSDAGNNLVVSSLSTQPADTKVFTLCHEYFNSSSCRNNGAINFYRGGSERGGFLTFDTDGQERLRIDQWGKLGIGTTNPDQKLTVNGKIHAQEIIVDLNVPAADYVFSKDYSLMPLHQVETFVKENSHLPEIPSASELKEKGLSVGEMQNKLLQKIEELTLYVIQLKKENETQNKQIENLQLQILKEK
ncbi:MAG: tail fiber protein [Dysgonamonadaceae bacterium]